MEESEEEERGPNLYGWGAIPDLLIEEIFSYLGIRDRFNASQVCIQWHEAFYTRTAWHTFPVDDYTLTRRRFNFYEGWQYRLDHLRMQQFVHQVGILVKRLVFYPMWNIFNLYQFMHLISCHSEKYLENPDADNACDFRIETLRFDFWCQHSTSNTSMIYGTGGELLECLRRLIGNLRYLKNLELIDLNLDCKEAEHLLDDACFFMTDQIIGLSLINLTKKTELGILHPGCFINLRILKITPHNINGDVIQLLGSLQKFKELHLIQNKHTKDFITPVPARFWRNVSNKFNVFLRATGCVDHEIIWQEKANVTSVLYDCPKSCFSISSILTVIDLYSTTIKEYGYLGNPKFVSSRAFKDRIDGVLLALCRICTHLEKLYVRNHMSTSTCLLIVSFCSSLKYLYVRKNAFLKRIDYMHHNLELEANLVKWIKANSKCYEATAKEVSRVLGLSQWTPLSDKEYKQLLLKSPPY